ncbi:MAG: CHAT domain-containing protein [Acidimicrobiales bacterium]
MTALPRATGVTDLLRPPSDAARLAHLHSEGLVDEVGLAWVLDGVEELVHDDPAAADDLAALCDTAARPLSLDAISARARYLRARVQAERGELDRALTLIEDARALWWGTADHLRALRTDLGRMQVLDDLGRHGDAAAVGQTLIDALESLAVDADDEELRGWMQAAALDNLGVACGFIGEHERALAAYAQAEATYRALGMEEETARPLANRGIELLELGRGREALDVLRAAESAFTAAGDRLWSAKCFGHIAQAHQQLDQFVDALRVLEPARAVLDELGAEAEAARLQLAIAGVYLAVGLFDEARAEATTAADRTSAAGMIHDAATARFTVALAHLSAGHLDEADEEVQVAGALFAQVGDPQQQARVRLAEADIAVARGQGREAADLAATAAEALESGGWLLPLAWAELRLADLVVDGDSAAAHLDRAVALAEQLRLPQLDYACDLRVARFHRRQGRSREAERLLREAIDQVEHLSASLPDHGLRRAFRADKLAAHDELVDFLVERAGEGDVAEALRTGDRAKAQTLIDLLAGTVGRRARRDAAPGIQEDLERPRVDLNATYGALMQAEPARAPTLRRLADELEQQISTLRVRSAVTEAPAPARAPRSAEGPGGQPSPSTPPLVALAYHVVGDDVIAFVAHGDHVIARRLVGALPHAEAELDRLGAQWSRFGMGASFARRHEAALLETSREILGSLHRLLVAPVTDALTEALVDAASDQLVVVPHRRLHEVPYHALHDGIGSLTERWAITVAPTLAGGGGPKAAGIDRGALLLARPDAHAPSVAAEARALAALLPQAHVLVGDTATSAALVAAVPGPGVIHIAGHGLYRSGNPLFSSLRLADRWVTAAEILELDLGGALVTLSACESGRQGGGTAEPVGLAWAFLAAGAAGVVVSQWVVHDDTTTMLMSELYRHLLDGAHPAVALRRAQLATADSHPHPFYWAPFTYVATTSPASDGSKS